MEDCKEAMMVSGSAMRVLVDRAVRHKPRDQREQERRETEERGTGRGGDSRTGVDKEYIYMDKEYIWAASTCIVGSWLLQSDQM